MQKFKDIEWMQVMGKGLLLTESSVPTRRYAPEPMYKKDVHSETQFDECNGLLEIDRQCDDRTESCDWASLSFEDGTKAT